MTAGGPTLCLALVTVCSWVHDFGYDSLVPCVCPGVVGSVESGLNESFPGLLLKASEVSVWTDVIVSPCHFDLSGSLSWIVTVV